MNDTKFNISGNSNKDKDKKKEESSDFEFKIEKQKEQVSSEKAGEPEDQKEKIEIVPKQPELTPGAKQEPKEGVSLLGGYKEESTIEEAAPEKEMPEEESQKEPQPKNEELPLSSAEPMLKPEKASKILKSVSSAIKARSKFKLDVKGMPIIYGLFVIIAISVFINIVFIHSSGSATYKIKENAILANKFALEKDSLQEEKEGLEAAIKELEKAALLEEEALNQAYGEKQKLVKQLKDFQERYYEESDGALEKYADEAKDMAKKVVAINKAYRRDKEAYDTVTAENKKLREETAELDKIVTEFTQKHINQQAVSLYNLGVAYTMGELYDEAIKAFNDSLGLHSYNPDAHYNLAVIYETVKRDNAMAIRHFQKYLEEITDGIERYEIEVKIDSLKRAVRTKKKYPILDFTE